MLTKNQIKLIKSLSSKKNRTENKLFVAEGSKVISEFLKSDYVLDSLYTTDSDLFKIQKKHVELISESELNKISFLTTPNVCLALFKIKVSQITSTNGLTLVLDTINDPGNLGTIIRLCDWFGIEQVICSQDTVDVYNPKVIQSTMGSLTRVTIHYQNITSVLTQKNMPVYGTFMDGDNIYKQSLPSNGFIVMGNEANGISKEIEQLVTHRITIPQFGTNMETESLNVATATAIILSEFKRLS